MRSIHNFLSRSKRITGEREIDVDVGVMFRDKCDLVKNAAIEGRLEFGWRQSGEYDVNNMKHETKLHSSSRRREVRVAQVHAEDEPR